MNLEGLIGADPSSGEIHLELLGPLATVILRNHSPEVEELRFAFLNALTLLGDWQVPESTYDHIDAELHRFVLTCRHSNLSDVMLVNLLIDYYRCDRALQLIRACLLSCRVRSRVDILVRALESGLRLNDCVKAGLPEIVGELLNHSKVSRRRLGRRLARVGLHTSSSLSPRPEI